MLQYRSYQEIDYFVILPIRKTLLSLPIMKNISLQLSKPQNNSFNRLQPYYPRSISHCSILTLC